MMGDLNRLTNADRYEIEMIASGLSDNELSDHQYTVLFEYYSDIGEMPYGTQKARDGDPYQWIYDSISEAYDAGRLHDMLSNL